MRRARVTRLPKTLSELIRAGGPERVARQAAQEAAQKERRFWFEELGKLEPVEDGPMSSAILMSWLQTLRRQLHIPAPRDRERIRAQTRERVRHYRKRQLQPQVIDD
jgi:hypothetical protein